MARLQSQAISWREIKETGKDGVLPFISGILLIMNVYMISSAKALHEWIGIKPVVKPKAKPFIVSIWYRPPDNKADIMRDFQLLIEGIEKLGLGLPTTICNFYQFH